MPTSARTKMSGILYRRADVGIGPYNRFANSIIGYQRERFYKVIGDVVGAVPYITQDIVVKMWHNVKR